MKNLATLFLLITSLSYCQNRIGFTYDETGNQTIRVICLSCPYVRKADETITEKTIANNDLIEDDTISGISYYPNPVREELYIKWINEGANFVSGIQVYAMSGQLISNSPDLRGKDITTISFQNYPQGLYNIILQYSNGEKKALKVAKQ